MLTRVAFVRARARTPTERRSCGMCLWYNDVGLRSQMWTTRPNDCCCVHVMNKLGGGCYMYDGRVLVCGTRAKCRAVFMLGRAAACSEYLVFWHVPAPALGVQSVRADFSNAAFMCTLA